MSDPVDVGTQAINKQMNNWIRQASGRVDLPVVATEEESQVPVSEAIKSLRTNAGSGTGLGVSYVREPSVNDWIRRSRVSSAPVEFVQVSGIGGVK